MTPKKISISLTREEAERVAYVLRKADAWTTSTEALDDAVIKRIDAKLRTEGRSHD